MTVANRHRAGLPALCDTVVAVHFGRRVRRDRAAAHARRDQRAIHVDGDAFGEDNAPLFGEVERCIGSANLCVAEDTPTAIAIESDVVGPAQTTGCVSPFFALAGNEAAAVNGDGEAMSADDRPAAG